MKNNFFFLTSYAKIQCTKDLDVQPETTKFLKENIGTMFFDICLKNIFPQARAIKAQTKQITLPQTKKLLHSEGNYQQNKKVAY